jgi:peptidoglycan/LPS O-acetylase OafA/YrhL
VSSTGNIQAGVRIPELDGLRGLAILLVVIHHYIAHQIAIGEGWAWQVIGGFFRLSWSGVDLFFVLSGFLIGGILLDQRRSENYFKTFYLRRVCRIFPLYFLWLGLFFLVTSVPALVSNQGWQAEVFAPRYPNWAYVFFVQNFFVAQTEVFGPLWLVAVWSLAVEEQFYLVAPLLVRFLPVQKLPRLILCVLVAVPIFRLFMYMCHPTVFVYVLLPCRMDTLLLGVLCACWIRDEPMRQWLGKNRRLLYLAFGILLVATAWLSQPGISSRTSFEMVSFGYSLLGLLYACLLLIVVTAKESFLAGFMRIPFLCYLGVIAYGVFMIHLAVAGLAHGLILGKNTSINNLSDGVVTLAAFSATVLLATASWRFFEKPMIDWGHSFSYATKIRPPTK